MKISKQNGDYQVLVSRDELRTIGHCILEGLENLSDAEFEARVGETTSDVRKLLDQIVRAYRELR